jgi:hypothetical protein
MTTEELLIERYKVIAPYPHSPYKVGDIIKPNNGRFVLTQTTHRDEFGETVRTEHLHKSDVAKYYPHLFQRLEWWEDRKPEEMPGYVKWDYKPKVDSEVMKNYVRKVEGWQQANYGVITDGQTTASRHWLPATLEDYTAYINQQQ